MLYSFAEENKIQKKNLQRWLILGNKYQTKTEKCHKSNQVCFMLCQVIRLPSELEILVSIFCVSVMDMFISICLGSKMIFYWRNRKN